MSEVVKDRIKASSKHSEMVINIVTKITRHFTFKN